MFLWRLIKATVAAIVATSAILAFFVLIGTNPALVGGLIALLMVVGFFAWVFVSVFSDGK